MKYFLKYLKLKRNIIAFLFLISLCLSLRIQNKTRNEFKLSFLNKLVLGINYYIVLIKDFPLLKEKISKLKCENAYLKERVFNILTKDSKKLNTRENISLTCAGIVSNSITKIRNFIVLDKGKKDKIFNGMGVITDNGVIGIVQQVTDNYSKAISLLNSDLLISVKLQSCGVIGSLNWSGGDPSIINLLYIPKYAKIKIDEDVITTGFDHCFPKNIKVGKVIEIKNNESDLFYEIKVKLYEDFSRINQVFLLNNSDSNELISIEKTSS